MTGESDDARAALRDEYLTKAYQEIAQSLKNLATNTEGTAVIQALCIHLGQIIVQLPEELHGATVDKCGELVAATIAEGERRGMSGVGIVIDPDKIGRPN
jgi:hypothetical protein